MSFKWQDFAVFCGGYFWDLLMKVAVTVIAARYFGGDLFGLWSYAISFFVFFGIVDDLALRSAALFSLTKSDRDWNVVKTVYFVLSLVTVVLLCIGFVVFKSGGFYSAVLISFCMVLLCNGIKSPYEISLYVKGKVFYVKILSAGFNAVVLFCLLCCVYFRQGFLVWINLYLAANIVHAVFVILAHSRLPKDESPFDLIRLKVFLRRIMPLLLSAIFVFLYHRADRFMLLYLTDLKAVGLYSAASRVAEVFTVLAVAVKTIGLPLLTKKEALTEKKSFQAFLYATPVLFFTPFLIVGSFYSEYIIGILFGTSFKSASPALAWLLAAEVFILLGIINNAILVVNEKQKYDPIFTGSSAVVNILLNLLMIPRFGVTGAAAATFAAQFTGPVIGLFLKDTRAYSRMLFSSLIKPVLGGCIMTVCLLNGMNSLFAMLGYLTVIVILEYKKLLSFIKNKICLNVSRESDA